MVTIRLCLRSVKESVRFMSLEELEVETVTPIEAKSIYRQAEAVAILEAIDQLPSENMRLVMRMCFEGLEPVRIAEVLNLGRGYVDTLKSRAVTRLRAILAARRQT